MSSKNELFLYLKAKTIQSPRSYQAKCSLSFSAILLILLTCLKSECILISNRLIFITYGMYKYYSSGICHTCRKILLRHAAPGGTSLLLGRLYSTLRRQTCYEVTGTKALKLYPLVTVATYILQKLNENQI